MPNLYFSEVFTFWVLSLFTVYELIVYFKQKQITGVREIEGNTSDLASSYIL